VFKKRNQVVTNINCRKRFWSCQSLCSKSRLQFLEVWGAFNLKMIRTGFSLKKIILCYGTETSSWRKFYPTSNTFIIVWWRPYGQ